MGLIVKNKTIYYFNELFSKSPELLIKSPGRINLMGEHTDYNDGYVFPMGIQSSMWLAVSKRDDHQVNCYSLNLSEMKSISIDKIVNREKSWGEYIKGVAWSLRKSGYKLAGWDGVFYSEIPVGAGLSSSAALELSFARAFAKFSNIKWSSKEMAIICQRAENEWVGVNCGIMDQLIVAAAKENSALLIDCRSLDFDEITIPSNIAFLIMDTSTRRGLVDTKYNQRRNSCQLASRLLNVKSLRDISLSFLKKAEHKLDKTIYKRAYHVVTENERTIEVSKIIDNGDISRVGELFKLSHESLRDCYEVSSPELDIMVDIANNNEHCYGARMTGAGFGGCAIAIVDDRFANEASNEIKMTYDKKTGLSSNIFVSKASEGTHIIEI